MAEYSASAEFLYKLVDLSDNSTAVYAGPCLLRGIHVVASLSAHDVVVDDDTTQIGGVPASAPIGSWFEFGDMRIETSLTVDPDDSATGTIAVVYKPFHDGGAGSGAGLP